MDAQWPLLSKWVGAVLVPAAKRSVNDVVPSRTLADGEWKLIKPAAHGTWPDGALKDIPKDDFTTLCGTDRLYRRTLRLPLTELMLILGDQHPDLKKAVTHFATDALSGQAQLMAAFCCLHAKGEEKAQTDEQLKNALIDIRDDLRRNDKYSSRTPLVVATASEAPLADSIGGMTFVELDLDVLPADIVAVVVPHGIATVQVDRAQDLTLGWDLPNATDLQREPNAIATLSIDELFRFTSTAPTDVVVVRSA